MGKKTESEKQRNHELFLKAIDRLKDLFELGILAGLAWLGYDRLKHPAGALLGPISYKLATSEGGTPPIAQIAGVSGLAFLGASFSDAGIKPQEGGGQGFWSNATQLQCPEGTVLDWNILHGWHCRIIRQPT